MPRKVLLSFLGTSNYVPVRYHHEGDRSFAPLEKYIQMSLVKSLATSFTSSDQVYVFLTKEARKSNWMNAKYLDRRSNSKVSNIGLAQQIEEEKYLFDVSPINIKGTSENEAIWETFESVYQCLEVADEVYLDITHSWRYLPMLGMTLLNYAKVLKQIKVKAIYYGALERLGLSYQINDMPEEERFVPILNLASFSELQDWTVAADDFVLDGNPSRLVKLTKDNLSGLIRGVKEQDEIINNLNSITGLLNELVQLLQTNRGAEIWDFNFKKLHQSLNQFSEERSTVKALNGIMQHIQKKVAGFQVMGNLQWLESVRWCIDHGLIQQGITQLQEGTISWLCVYFEKKAWAEVGYFDMVQNGEARRLISAAVQFIGNNRSPHTWRGVIAKNKALAQRIMAAPVAIDLHAPFKALSKEARNDINHGGYNSQRIKDASIFRQILEDAFVKIAFVLKKYENTYAALLNLSNHSSEDWSAKQIQAASEQYGKVIDMAFPYIDPNLDDKNLQKLVNEYFFKVSQLNPKAIHIMGEMTFTFALVEKLKAVGVTCIASTSDRIISNLASGEKVVDFQFVGFRTY